MAKYRKIEARIWNDAKFNSLSDKAKLLFFFLLTHPHLTALGAMRASNNGLANELNWSEKDFTKAFDEVFHQGMVRHDEKHCLVWLVNFLKYNKPENPNVVKSWDKWLDYLPECALKTNLIQSVRTFVEGLSKTFREALPKAFRKGMANHEHEHEHETEHEHEKDIHQVAVATRPVSVTNESSTMPAQDDGNRKVQADVQAIFDYWRQALTHPRAKLDKKREAKIKQALVLGYSAVDLKLAIDGCKASPFNMGNNEQRQRYDDITLILRHASNIERFMQAASGSVFDSTAPLNPQNFEGVL